MDLELVGGSGDRQGAAVVGEVAARTQKGEVQRVVAAAIGAVNEMVNLEAAGGAAAGDAAAPAVAPPDEANDTGWDVLGGPFGGSAVERADVLRIAQPPID